MNKIKLLSILLFTAILCAFIPNFAGAAGGAGPEPGDNCGLEGVKYDAPPLIGDVEFKMIENELVAVGFLERHGKDGCLFPVFIVLGPITSEGFDALTAKDIKQWCLDEIMGIAEECEGLSDDQPYEVIAVGAFKRIDNGYSARLIVMPLQ